MKWKHFSCYWPFLGGIHWSLVNSPYKGQWHGALMFSLICAWINGWVNNREAGDLRCHCAHYDVIVIIAGLLHKLSTGPPFTKKIMSYWFRWPSQVYNGNPCTNKTHFVVKRGPGCWFIMPPYQYSKSYSGDKTILLLSYLHNEISLHKMFIWHCCKYTILEMTLCSEMVSCF